MLPLTKHALSFSRSTPLTILENWGLNFEREKYRREYHALMKARGVDVLLCPAYVGAGVLQGEPKYWHYTSIWNILDQPAVTFPSGVVTNKARDIPDEGYQPRSDLEAREWKACESLPRIFAEHEATNMNFHTRIDDAELFDGIPVSIQLVGKRHRDEELLEAARIIDETLRS